MPSVKDHSHYNWTMSDSEAKKVRHETAFPQDKKTFNLGTQMVRGPWDI